MLSFEQTNAVVRSIDDDPLVRERSLEFVTGGHYLVESTPPSPTESLATEKSSCGPVKLASNVTLKPRSSVPLSDCVLAEASSEHWLFATVPPEPGGPH